MNRKSEKIVGLLVSLLVIGLFPYNLVAAETTPPTVASDVKPVADEKAPTEDAKPEAKKAEAADELSLEETDSEVKKEGKTKTPPPEEKGKTAKKNESEDRRNLRFGPSVGTDFPFWVGADLRLMLFDRMGLSAGVGTTPKAYSSLIGQTAASIGGNAAYKPAVEALYSNNSIIRVGLEYRFRGPTGWALGLNYYRQSSNGDANLADIAQATNQNFQSLLTLLNSLGRSAVIRGEVTMTMAQIQTSYTWSVFGCFLKGSLGITKFTDATLKLSSQSSTFDNSASGQATYAEAEKSLRTTLVNYGISPTLGLELMYLF